MNTGFTIDEKGRLVFLRQSDDKNQAPVEADEKVVNANRREYERFIEDTANAGAQVDTMPESIREDVVKARASGLKKKEDERHSAEGKRLGELAKVPRKAPAKKKVKAKKAAKKRRR